MVINSAIDQIKKYGITNVTKSSYDYLSKSDTQDKLREIFKDLQITNCTIHCKIVLELMYIELEVENDNNKKYILNLWPCSSCACIGVQECIS